MCSLSEFKQMPNRMGKDSQSNLAKLEEKRMLKLAAVLLP